MKITKRKKLTAAYLKRHHICEDWIKRFKKLFPKGTYCSISDAERFLIAYRRLRDLPMFYASDNILTKEGRIKFTITVGIGNGPALKVHCFAQLWRAGHYRKD